MNYEDIIDVFNSVDRPFITVQDVADKGGISSSAAYRQLQRHFKNGKLEKFKPTHSAAIWWPPEV